jgi:hypothetical protein
MQAGDDGMYALVTAAAGTNHHKMEAITNGPLGPAAVAIIAVISVAGPASAAEWSARAQRDAGTRSLPPKATTPTNRRTALGAAPSSPQTGDMLNDG